MYVYRYNYLLSLDVAQGQKYEAPVKIKLLTNCLLI